MKLYHYCSNATFHSIVTNRSIWLSSLSLSNDSLEGKLVSKILVELAEADGLDRENIEKLRWHVGSLNNMWDGLGFCLSEDGDLLSQWRGYADDARGVSIGFSRDYLQGLSEAHRSEDNAGFTLKAVIYDHEEQVELLRPAYEKLKELIDQGAFQNVGRWSLLDTRSEEERKIDDAETLNILAQFRIEIFPLIGDLFLLKTYAFKEEQEWRLISLYIKSGSDPCSFRPNRCSLKPYREFQLLDLNYKTIEEVVLGPKNNTPKNLIEAFLKQNGMQDVNVINSEASYR